MKNKNGSYFLVVQGSGVKIPSTAKDEAVLNV